MKGLKGLKSFKGSKELVFYPGFGLLVSQTSITKALENHQLNTLLHNDVFAKLDVASDLFEVLVLKTESTVPYSSVFLELDCAYWDAEKEQKLRIKMQE